MKVPVPPIFIVEGLDVSVHDSVESAQRWLEPWWVEQKLGKVYDSVGTLLKLKITGKRVLILPGEQTAGHAKELESILRRFLKEIGEPIDDDLSCDLEYLVKYCHKFIND